MLEIDRDAKIIYQDDKEIWLVPKGWTLFNHLWGHPERFCSTDELWRVGWPNAEAQIVQVRYTIQQIRKKLPGVGIQYRHGYGWRILDEISTRVSCNLYSGV